VHGLTDEEVRQRQAIYGPNRLENKAGWKFLRTVASQFIDPLIIILLAAAVVSYLLGEIQDAILIGIIVLLNGTIGFVQEFRAEKALEKIKQMVPERVEVYRNGRRVTVNSEELVPGDVVLLEAGDKVPADGTIQGGDVNVDESALTGESVTVLKSVNEELFMGTLVTRGRCTFVVTATGMKTRMGSIAGMVQTDTKTPFQQKLERLSANLGKLVLVIAALVGISGVFLGHTWLEMLELAISLGVAAVPEGLPILATMCLAIGVQKMARRNAIIKKLPSVEALGSVNVLCVDKTGTITENKLTVKEWWGDVKGIKMAASFTSQEVKDPVDVALREWAGENQVEAFIPFSSETRMATAFHKNRLYVKGAPVSILPMCGDADAKKINKQVEDMASRGLKVLALAEGRKEGKLKLQGLVGLYDPPRKGIREVLQKAKNMGLAVKMITGDHPRTALAIAREAGIDGPVLSLNELEKASHEQIVNTAIFARVAPEDKLKIVEALQKEGLTVAMTGDGVNDSPTLKKANIGISLGSGTELAREVSDIILMDDNLETIVNAVTEGRNIFKNVKTSTRYVLGTNISEIVAIVAGLFTGQIIFRPIQILWLNLVTDSLPALAFAYDEHDGESVNPDHILDKRDWSRTLLVGGLMGVTAFWVNQVMGPLAALNVLIYGEIAYQPIIRFKNGTRNLWNLQAFFFLGIALTVQILAAMYLGKLIGLSLPGAELLWVAGLLLVLALVG